MKQWFPNPNRIREIFTEETVKRAADAILAYRTREVFFALLYSWMIFLGMVFTMLVTIRVALSLPLF